MYFVIIYLLKGHTLSIIFIVMLIVVLIMILLIDKLLLTNFNSNSIYMR